MRLIAQLLDHAPHTMRSMKTAQPGIIEGRTIECFWNFFCADSACVGCIHSMHAEKHYLIVAFQQDGKKPESVQRELFLNMKCYKNTPGFTWSNTSLKIGPNPLSSTPPQ